MESIKLFGTTWKVAWKEYGKVEGEDGKMWKKARTIYLRRGTFLRGMSIATDFILCIILQTLTMRKQTLGM